MTININGAEMSYEEAKEMFTELKKIFEPAPVTKDKYEKALDELLDVIKRTYPHTTPYTTPYTTPNIHDRPWYDPIITCGCNVDRYDQIRSASPKLPSTFGIGC